MPLKIIIIVTFIIAGIVVNWGMPKNIIDQIQMVTVVGYDYVDEETIRGTFVGLSFLQKGEVQDLIYTDTASMVYENRTQLNAQASQELHTGKLEVALYNDELAKRGLNRYVDFLIRDPGIGSRVILAVVDGSTLDLVKSVKSKQGTGVYLSDLLEHNIKNGNLPKVNLKQFSSNVKGKTRDSFLPFLNLEDGIPNLKGIAFFKDDKFVESIPIDEAAVFKMLYQSVVDGEYNLKDEKYKASIQNIDSTKDVHVKKDQNGSLKVTIHVKSEGVIREFTGENLEKKIPEIQKELEKDFKQKAIQLIKQFQELNIDPLAIEENVKASIRSYDKKRFKPKYPTLSIDVNAKFNLTEYGTRR